MMQYHFSEISEHTNPATQHHIPEDMNHQQNCCGNLVSHKAQVPDQEVHCLLKPPAILASYFTFWKADILYSSKLVHFKFAV
jgi:hypothetical protein